MYLVWYTDPEILFFTETKLNNKVSSSEFLPTNFKVFPEDRASSGGGYMTVIRNTMVAGEVDVVEVSTQLIWVNIGLHNYNPLYIGSFINSQVLSQQLGKLGRYPNHTSKLTKNNLNPTFISWWWLHRDDLIISINSPVNSLRPSDAYMRQ